MIVNNMIVNNMIVNNMIVNNVNFEVGDVYYSVGPLQFGQVEEWEFTGDIYDIKRAKINNMFKTSDEAQHFLDYIKNYSQHKDN